MPTLGRYLSTICDDDRKAGGPVFRFKENPTLNTTRTNVILLYRGSFNPPHRGHLAVLWHAYKQLADHLNIVGAIIRVTSDDALKTKYSSHNGKRVIPINDRARLWREDPHFPPWAWVFTPEVSGAESVLQKEIKALARKDGCRVRFARLYGPDCADVVDPKEMTIVSDVGRKAKYDEQNGLPGHHWTDFGPWHVEHGEDTRVQSNVVSEWEEVGKPQQVAANKDRARKVENECNNPVPHPSQEASDLAVTKVDGLLRIDEQGQPSTPPKAAESLTTQLARLSSPKLVSVCWQKNTQPIKSLRFLRSTPEQNAPFRGISSSEIQKKVHELKGYKLKSALESMALSPSLLWDMLLPEQLRHHQSDEEYYRPIEQDSSSSSQLSGNDPEVQSMIEIGCPPEKVSDTLYPEYDSRVGKKRKRIASEERQMQDEDIPGRVLKRRAYVTYTTRSPLRAARPTGKGEQGGGQTKEPRPRMSPIASFTRLLPLVK
ncbi:MAG: hypothetical protein L6R39_001342 [Caloplaca ligustica]|nr:MAG: hypothetical protein L6R39_001342 [Caloplaca ligustica]